MTERTINMTEYTYSRTASGKSWKSKPDNIQQQILSWEQYLNMNSTTTCRFFRKLGGYERVERSYTSRGYLPIRLISINPDRTIKIIREYYF